MFGFSNKKISSFDSDNKTTEKWWPEPWVDKLSVAQELRRGDGPKPGIRVPGSEEVEVPSHPCRVRNRSQDEGDEDRHPTRSTKWVDTEDTPCHTRFTFTLVLLVFTGSYWSRQGVSVHPWVSFAITMTRKETSYQVYRVSSLVLYDPLVGDVRGWHGRDSLRTPSVSLRSQKWPLRLCRPSILLPTSHKQTGVTRLGDLPSLVRVRSTYGYWSVNRELCIIVVHSPFW